MPTTSTETACDYALIQRYPGMNRDELDQFMADLAMFCKRHGCRLVEWVPEEILERVSCEAGLPDAPVILPQSGKAVLNNPANEGSSPSALTNFPVQDAKEMTEEEKANLNPDPEQVVQVHRLGPDFASGVDAASQQCLSGNHPVRCNSGPLANNLVHRDTFNNGKTICV